MTDADQRAGQDAGQDADQRAGQGAGQDAGQDAGKSVRPTLLLVHHTTSPATQALLDAAVEGTRAEGLEGVDVRVRPALAATPIDVLDATGFVLGTPANIGYMSGALKYFFDTVYYPTLVAKPGAPYGLYVHGNSDTTGAIRAVESITKGMGWTPVHDPVSVMGTPTKEDTEAVWDLAATVTATIAGLLGS